MSMETWSKASKWKKPEHKFKWFKFVYFCNNLNSFSYFFFITSLGIEAIQDGREIRKHKHIADLLILFPSTSTHLFYNSRLSVMSQLLVPLLAASASSGASASWSFLRIQFRLLDLDTLGLFTGTENDERKRKKDSETGRWRRRRRCCGLNSQMSGGRGSMYVCMSMSWLLGSVNMTSRAKTISVDICNERSSWV